MATSGGRVRLREALDPLVLAIDIGSTASRGDVFDAAGRPVEGGRHKIPHQFTTDRDGTSEIAPDQIVGEVHQIITALVTEPIQQRTGCRLHASYLPPRLRWLRATMPDTFASVRHWMSLGEYIYLQIRCAFGDLERSRRVPRRTSWCDERSGCRPSRAG